MPGPLSNATVPITNKAGEVVTIAGKIMRKPRVEPKPGKRLPGAPNGKTKHDKESGKHARRLVNRKSDPIRNGGGKQFRSKDKA